MCPVLMIATRVEAFSNGCVAMSDVTDEQQKSKGSRSALRTRVSASWTAVVVAAFVLVLLVIFIAQNTQHSSVNFCGFMGAPRRQSCCSLLRRRAP